MSLTIKQQKFVDEYLKCFNATEAARRAGYSATNGSLATIGYDNLRKVEIKEKIDHYLQESAMSAQEVLMRLAEQARNDLGDFSYIENGSDLANHPLSRTVKKFKKKVWYDKDGDPHEEIELELYDAQKALDTLAKYHNLFKDTSINLNIDVKELSDDELERIINGEEPLSVVSSKG